VTLPHQLDPVAKISIVGWVDTAVLGPHVHGFGGSWGTGGEQAMPRMPTKHLRRVTCNHDVPLIADSKGEQHLVGAVLPKVALDVLTDGELVELGLDAVQIAVAPGSRLLAKRAALADCTDTP
jgi:hypothetical protein